MPSDSPSDEAHPAGESPAAADAPTPTAAPGPMIVDTPGGRFRADFSPALPVSTMGALVFFAQFLQGTGAFDALIADAPLAYEGNRAHGAREALGTLALGILAGHYRFAHLAALRGDPIAPSLLGLKQIVSHDCVREALLRIAPEQGRAWLRHHLDASCQDFMDTPWVLDIDTTIKPIYGRQEGATLGYNPHKPGRPSHAYHTYWIATLRLCLDVEVHPGDHAAAAHGFSGLWALLDALPTARRPHLLRGDCAYGQEEFLAQAEQRHQRYLCKLRRTTRARALIAHLEHAAALTGTSSVPWTDAGQGWQGASAQLQLHGWSRPRRVIILRRRLNDQRHPRARRRLAREQTCLGETRLLLPGPAHAACAPVIYEHQILVTDLPYEILTLATLYRERGDAENPFDELKNQWSWSGFTSHALATSQHAARLAALIYNWWTLYHRLLQPGQHHEAITTRPRLLQGAARQSEHAGQRHLAVRLNHAEAPRLQTLIEQVAKWIQTLLTNATRWTATERWRQIAQRIVQENFPQNGPAPPATA
jgi:hypothetical protein